MTLIASWVSADDKPGGKGLSALYFCSDSRFVWTVGNRDMGKPFDEGQKIFSSSCYPEIFCYCGDVQFPVYTIQPLISEIDKGLFFRTGLSFEDKTSDLQRYFEEKLKRYPPEVMTQSFSIYYATYMTSEFHVVKFACDKQSLITEIISLKNESTILFCDGSGSKSFSDHWTYRDNEKINEHKTSRNAYRCVVETIEAGEDCKTGGVPQLIALYRNGKVQHFGIIKNGGRYFQGRKITDNDNLDIIDWRNDNFERVNPHTMQLLLGAQPQPFAH